MKKNIVKLLGIYLTLWVIIIFDTIVVYQTIVYRVLVCDKSLGKLFANKAQQVDRQRITYGTYHFLCTIIMADKTTLWPQIDKILSM